MDSEIMNPLTRECSNRQVQCAAVWVYRYRNWLKSGPQVVRIFQSSWGRSGKQQQEQNSPNLGDHFLTHSEENGHFQFSTLPQAVSHALARVFLPPKIGKHEVWRGECLSVALKIREGKKKCQRGKLSLSLIHYVIFRVFQTLLCLEGLKVKLRDS